MLESPSRTHSPDEVIQQTEWSGVPVFWLDAPEPFLGALLFRVGRADETLRLAGLSHVVEHLALSRFDRGPYQHNGQVESAISVFYARGSDEEVLEHLARVAASLADLPLDRLEREKRVLAAEASTMPPGLDARLLSLRFGPAGYGLVNHPEFGLDWMTPEHVADWAGARFTAGNASIWLTGEPPEGLGELGLPPGERIKPPVPDPIPSLELPAHLADGTGGVALSLLADRSSAIHSAFMVAIERAHKSLRLGAGTSYAPGGTYFVLDGHRVQLVINADCDDREAGKVQEELLGLLEDLAENGPTEEEAEWDRTMLARSLHDPQWQPGALDAHTRDALMGIELPSRAKLIEERNALTSRAVADALAEAMPTLMVLAPMGVAPSGGRKLAKYAPESTERVEGSTYDATAEWKQHGELSQLVVGKDGFSYVRTDDGEVMSWTFEDCVAGIQLPSGATTVIGRDGSWITIYPDRWGSGHEALDAIEESIGVDRLVPVAGRALDIGTKVREELGDRIGRVAAEVDLLPDALAAEEEIRHLAEARRGHQIGLLGVTDQRLFFIFWGTTEREFFEKPLDAVGEVKLKGIRKKWILVSHDDETTEFRDIEPPNRAQQLAVSLSADD